MSTIFVLSHWGQGGKGSGYTIVVASSRNMARFMVRDYLNAKSEGYRQFHNMNSFEVELLEDSSLFSHLELDVEKSAHGVHSEYWLTPEDEETADAGDNAGGKLLLIYTRA
jgi:hypothetical protein